MDDNTIKYSHPVPPFVRYCSAIIPTMFDDSLSYYEALCALWKWLQDNLVNVVNNNAAVTDEYQKQVKELEEYVKHYFDNLDVQQEINNKLDQMAEDGTLENIINNKVLLHATRSIVELDALSTVYYGDMVLIKFKYMDEVKTAIVDFYDDPSHYVSTNYDSLVNKMVAKGYTKFDYAIVSHYHLDHVGCLPSFLQDARLDFSDCTFYLPPTPDYSKFTNPDYVPDKEQEIIGLLNDAGITHVTATNTTIDINPDTSITFYNCDTSEYSNYYNLIFNGKTIYNNFSVVTEIKHKENIITLTGDIQGGAEEVVVNQGIHKPTILKIPHHGLTGPKASYLPFIQRFKGEINLIELPQDRVAQGIYNTYPLLYLTGLSGDINFVSDGIASQAFSEHGIVKQETTTTQRNLADNLVTDSYDLAPVASSIYTIKENDDLNDYTDFGTYECPSAGICETLSNLPNYHNTAFKLYVNQLSAYGRIKQTLVYANTGDVGNSREYERYGVVTDGVGAFGPWQVNAGLDCGYQLANNSNLDDLTIGDYSCASGASASTMQGIPTGLNSAFRLMCIQTSGVSDRYIQIIIPQATPAKMFMRNKTGSGWSSWYSFTGTLVS